MTHTKTVGSGSRRALLQVFFHLVVLRLGDFTAGKAPVKYLLRRFMAWQVRKMPTAPRMHHVTRTNAPQEKQHADSRGDDKNKRDRP